MRLAHGILAFATVTWSLVVGGSGAVIAQQQVPAALRYLPPQAFAAASAQPAAIMQTEAVQMAPVEVVQAALIRDLAIDPAKVSRVTAFFTGPVQPPQPPGYGLVIDFTEPVDARAILPMFQRMPPQVAAHPQLQAMWPRIEAVEGNRVLFAPEAILKQMKAAAAAEPVSLAKRLASLTQSHVAAVIEPAPVRDDLDQLMATLPELPPPFVDVRKVPSLIESVQATVNLGKAFRGSLRVQGIDGPATDKLFALTKTGLQVMRLGIIAESQQKLQSDDPVEQAMARYMLRMADRMVASLTPEREANALLWETEQVVPLATTGVLVAMILPAIQAARESARMANASNNLKQIAVACHLYAERHGGQLPPRYSVDKDGKPLLSWRVHLLPYLEQADLYRQFKLDEPWDSPHNIKLADQMPAIYQDPNAPSESQTVYQVLVGPGTVYQQRIPATFGAIDNAAGLGAAVLAVEADADRAVIWTRPDDLAVPNPGQVPAGLGGLRPNNVFLAIFCDGHIERLTTADPSTPRQLAPLPRENND